MGEFGIGQPVKRFEDTRLLRGHGRYINDVVYLGDDTEPRMGYDY